MAGEMGLGCGFPVHLFNIAYNIFSCVNLCAVSQVRRHL